MTEEPPTENNELNTWFPFVSYPCPSCNSLKIEFIGFSFPMAMMRCENCGQVLFFNVSQEKTAWNKPDNKYIG